MIKLIISLVLINTVFAKEELTSEKIFEGMTLENIEKVNPLKGQEVSFDENLFEMIVNKYKLNFVDEDNDNADDRLELMISKGDYNDFSKLYMYQSIYLYKFFYDRCKDNPKQNGCLKVAVSLGLKEFHRVCKKQIEQKLKVHKSFFKFEETLYRNSTIRNTKIKSKKDIDSSEIYDMEKLGLYFPNLKCNQEGET